MAQCPKYIPDTPAGGVVDLTCGFDLPIGKTVASVPVLQGLDFQGPLGSSSSAGDTGGVVTVALALIAALLALIALGTTVAGLRIPFASVRRQASDARTGRTQEPQADEEDDNTW
jgi:hypothetical protein